MDIVEKTGSKPSDGRHSLIPLQIYEFNPRFKE